MGQTISSLEYSRFAGMFGQSKTRDMVSRVFDLVLSYSEIMIKLENSNTKCQRFFFIFSDIVVHISTLRKLS